MDSKSYIIFVKKNPAATVVFNAMWVGIGSDGMGWMVIIGHRCSKNTLGANKFHKCIRMYDFESLLVTFDDSKKFEQLCKSDVCRGYV